jgi:hypothetical protein
LVGEGVGLSNWRSMLDCWVVRYSLPPLLYTYVRPQ